MKHNGRTMTKVQVAALAEQLRKAERAGDVGRAYRLLKLGTADDAALIASCAGHAIVSTNDRVFWEFLQRQIAKACRHLCDGFELRQLLAR